MSKLSFSTYSGNMILTLGILIVVLGGISGGVYIWYTSDFTISHYDTEKLDQLENSIIENASITGVNHSNNSFNIYYNSSYDYPVRYNRKTELVEQGIPPTDYRDTSELEEGERIIIRGIIHENEQYIEAYQILVGNPIKQTDTEVEGVIKSVDYDNHEIILTDKESQEDVLIFIHKWLDIKQEKDENFNQQTDIVVNEGDEFYALGSSEEKDPYTIIYAKQFSPVFDPEDSDIPIMQ